MVINSKYCLKKILFLIFLLIELKEKNSINLEYLNVGFHLGLASI